LKLESNSGIFGAHAQDKSKGDSGVGSKTSEREKRGLQEGDKGLRHIRIIKTTQREEDEEKERGRCILHSGTWSGMNKGSGRMNASARELFSSREGGMQGKVGESKVPSQIGRHKSHSEKHHYTQAKRLKRSLMRKPSLAGESQSRDRKRLDHFGGGVEI